MVSWVTTWFVINFYMKGERIHLTLGMSR